MRWQQSSKQISYKKAPPPGRPQHGADPVRRRGPYKVFGTSQVSISSHIKLYILPCCLRATCAVADSSSASDAYVHRTHGTRTRALCASCPRNLRVALRGRVAGSPSPGRSAAAARRLLPPRNLFTYSFIVIFKNTNKEINKHRYKHT